LAKSSTVLFQNFELPRNGAKQKCKLLNICQAQAPGPGERVVQNNALKPQDRH
jgi:hypothetical protein